MHTQRGWDPEGSAAELTTRQGTTGQQLIAAHQPSTPSCFGHQSSTSAITRLRHFTAQMLAAILMTLCSAFK